MTDWDFGPGLVPNVQPGDIRNALAVLLPLRRSGQKGIVGDRRLLDGCDPSSNISAVCMRTSILLISLEQGLLSKWLEGDTLRDTVFQVAATYPFIFGDDRSLDISSFITALEASG